jgi:hypothetical protein
MPAECFRCERRYSTVFVASPEKRLSTPLALKAVVEKK